MHLYDFLDAAALVLASVILTKGTLLLVAGLVALGGLRLLRQPRPGTEAAAWSAVALILGLLPILSVTLPPLFVVPRPTPSLAWWPSGTQEPPPGVMSPTGTETGTARAVPQEPGAALQTFAADTPNDPQHAGRARLLRLPAWFAILWLAGTMLLLVRLVRSMFAVRSLVRRAHPWDPRGDNLCASGEAKRVMVAAVPVPVMWSAEVVVPITTASPRPVIILPAASRAWASDRLRIVLLHENSHVARRDHLSHLLAEVVCALYWPNLLVWWAAARARLARELAADACVLEYDIDPAMYAKELVSFARSAIAPRHAAVSLAARSALSVRIRAIMRAASHDRSTGGSGARGFRHLGAAGAITASAMIAAPVAALSFVPAAPETYRLGPVEVSRPGAIGDSALYALLFDDVPAERNAAARLIARSDTDRRVTVRAELLAMFADTCHGPRWRAARGFRHLGDGGAVAPLVKQLVADDNLYVRAMLAQAIAVSDVDEGARHLRLALVGAPRRRFSEVGRAIDSLGETPARARLLEALRRARQATYKSTASEARAAASG